MSLMTEKKERKKSRNLEQRRYPRTFQETPSHKPWSTRSIRPSGSTPSQVHYVTSFPSQWPHSASFLLIQLLILIGIMRNTIITAR